MKVAFVRRWKQGASFGLLFLFTLLLLSLGNVFRSELTYEWDEAAHFTTGLMVRDYLAQGFPDTPLGFAKTYYLHYPKIAFGHWPPLFYALQAVFTLLFGASITTVLVFMGLITATLSFSLYRIVSTLFRSQAAGLFAALLFLCIPIVQSSTGTIMSDMAVALFCFWTMLLWARYLNTRRQRDALAFAALASLAILTKGNGYAMIFMPPIAILLTRQWDVLKERSLWIAAGVIAVLCLPWSMATRDLITPTMQYRLGIPYILQASWFYSHMLAVLPGLPIAFFSLIGVWARVIRKAARGPVRPIWASAAGLLIGIVAFHSLVPAGIEVRYLLSALPPVLMFMTAGVQWTAGRFGRFGDRTARRAGMAISALLGVVFLLTTFTIPVKRSFGFNRVAEDIASDPQFRDAVILCSSNDLGEGLLISELQVREHRPGHIILRASHLLAESDWNGRSYKLRLDNRDEIARYLESIPVGLIVIDMTPTVHEKYAHHELLRAAARESGYWQLYRTYSSNTPTTMPGARIEVYRANGPIRHGNSQFSVEMTPMPRILINTAGSVPAVQ